MYYISIYFDQKTTARLQDYINLAAKKSGNTFMSDQNVPPHPATIQCIGCRILQLEKL